MAATATSDLPRLFKWCGVDLADPDPSASIVQVRDMYAAGMYPELTNVAIPESKTVGGYRVYEFTKAAVKTKG